MRDWDWNFGKTPQFSHVLETRIDGVGIFDVHMQVEKGIVEDCVVFSDSLLPDLVEKIPEALRGRAYSRKDLGQGLDTLIEVWGDIGTGPEETEKRLALSRQFRVWLLGNLED